MARTGQLGHAGSTLFCPDRHDLALADFADPVSAASLFDTRIWNELSCHGGNSPVQGWHERVATAGTQILLAVLASCESFGRRLGGCICAQWIQQHGRFSGGLVWPASNAIRNALAQITVNHPQPRIALAIGFISRFGVSHGYFK